MFSYQGEGQEFGISIEIRSKSQNKVPWSSFSVTKRDMFLRSFLT